MFGSLAGAEDDFGKATPNLAMMVDARKAKVLERQMPELFYRIIYTNLAVLDLFKKSFYLFNLNRSFLITFL